MPRDAGEQEDRPSVISKGLHIDGDLISGGHVHIDGTVKGDLQVASAVVGENASIEGNIAADRISVHGFVSGNITARVIEIRKTAHVIGDTMHDDLFVEKGACLDGNFGKRTIIALVQVKSSA